MAAIVLTMIGFNPRSRVRSDTGGAGELYLTLQFQSTLPGKERPMTCSSTGHPHWFQSTLPGKERLGGRSFGQWRGCFNPRSRVRSDNATWVRLMWYE